MDAIGTESYADGEDGLMLFSHNPVVASLSVTGVQIELSNATVAGSIVISSLHDSTALFNEDVYNPLASSNAHVITATDLTNGFVNIPFTQAIYIGPGQYYSGVELFSNSGANEIDILDDVTIPQPWWTSMIYIANGATLGLYSNGNALAVRMMVDILTSNEEMGEVPDVKVWPNPSLGVANVNSDRPIDMIWIFSADGQMIQGVNGYGQNRIELNLSHLASGFYHVQVESDSRIHRQKLVLN